jgi:methyl coenzyme M reductase subunit D
LTLKYERVAKIMKVATINRAITRIARCSALGIVVRGPFIARRVGTGCGAYEYVNHPKRRSDDLHEPHVLYGK